MTTSANTIGGAINLINLNLRFKDAIRPLSDQGELSREQRRAIARRLDKLQDVVRECSAEDLMTTIVVPTEDEIWDPVWVRAVRGTIYLLARLLRWRMALSSRSGVEWRVNK